MNEYEKFLFTKFLPMCKQSMLQDEAIKGSLDHPILLCSDFIPTLTNHGICLSKNSADLDRLFKPGDYLSKFKETFYPQQYHHEVENIQADLSFHHFTFFVDGNSFQDLKKGTEWKSSSNRIFNLGIHSTNDTADIRGWYNQIMNIPTGYITKITIKQSQLKADKSLRSVSKERRGCRFTEENDDLSSVKWYSKVNCLLDCKMTEAEKLCGCRPWDYLSTDPSNKSSNDDHLNRICDFYGTSCFNKILQENTESACREKCVPNCDEINYAISMYKEPIDPGRRICNYDAKPNNVLELEIKRHISSQFMENGQYGNGINHNASSPPERRVINLIKELLLGADDKIYLDEKASFEKLCAAKLNTDVAAIIISIDSPVFTRMIKSSKVSFFDKLAILGNK